MLPLDCFHKPDAGNFYFCKTKTIIVQSNSEIVKAKMNEWGSLRRPFLFVIDFEMNHPMAILLDDVNPQEIMFDINGVRNFSPPTLKEKPLQFMPHPVSKEYYCKAFQKVQQHIRRGDSFLLNLTFPSRIESNYTLKDFFYRSRAKYKLWLKDRFVSFSPEIFVQTEGLFIRSFPMKGTLDATLPNAENSLLSNQKELAEHFTIVDLIRNDLSMVAKKVRVKRFRYLDHIKTHKNEILQTSSEIEGELAENFNKDIGNILFQMLPAGSISGAPKKKTIEIIRQSEAYQRGFYTGITGIFDGENLDCAVLIRYIEQDEQGLVYKSGGGITAQSHCEEEYKELIEKIYVPVS